MSNKTVNIELEYRLEALEKSFSKVEGSLRRHQKSLSNTMSSVGKKATLMVSAPIIAGLGLAVKEFADFEQTMKTLEAITPDLQSSKENLEILSNLAKDLGISTRFTAEEVGNLMVNYSKLGFAAYEIQAITKNTLMLANATGSDLAEAALVAGGTLRGFNLEAKEMERVTNVMAMAFTNSALDLEKWKVSVSKVAPIAATLGISIEEVAAMFGVLADANIEASIIGTSMRKIFTDLAKTGMSYEEAMIRIGNASVSMTEDQAKLDNQIISSASGMAKNTEALNLFQQRAMTTAMTLETFNDKVQENIVKFGDWRDVTEDGLTALENMSAIIDSSLKLSFVRLKSAVSGLGIEFGERLAPALNKVASFISDIAIRFAGLNDMTKDVIIAFSLLAAIAGPLLVVLGGIGAAMSVIAAATGVAASSIIAITAVVVLLATAIYAFYRYIDKNSEAVGVLFRNTFKKVANAVKIAAFSIINSLADMADSVGLDGFRDKLTKQANDIYSTLAGLEKPVEFKGFGFDEDSAAKMIAKGKEIGKKTMDALKDAMGLSDLDLGDKGDGEIRPTKSDLAGVIKLNSKEITLENLGWDKSIAKDLEDAYKELGKVARKAGAETFRQTSQLTLDYVTDYGKRQMQYIEDTTKMIESMTEEAIFNVADMLGTMLTDEDFTGKDFGRGMLEMIAGFMQELGALMIAFGIQYALFEKAIFSGNPILAIAAGAAMVAAGAAIKGAMADGVDGKGGGSSYSSPSVGNRGVRYTGDELTSTVRVRGRDLYLTQSRSRSFRR